MQEFKPYPLLLALYSPKGKVYFGLSEGQGQARERPISLFHAYEFDGYVLRQALKSIPGYIDNSPLTFNGHMVSARESLAELVEKEITSRELFGMPISAIWMKTKHFRVESLHNQIRGYYERMCNQRYCKFFYDERDRWSFKQL